MSMQESEHVMNYEGSEGVMTGGRRRRRSGVRKTRKTRGGNKHMKPVHGGKRRTGRRRKTRGRK